jgi:hypothetical protein
MSAEFDATYFERLVYEANDVEYTKAEVVNEMKAQEDILKKAKLSFVKELMTCEPKDFYNILVKCFGSAVVDRLHDTAFVTKVSTSLNNFSENLKTKPKLVLWLYKAIRFVCAKVLGIIKFSWDTLLITGTFVGRFGCRLVSNVGVALIKTCVETKEDAIYAGKAIGHSFKENIIGN